MSNEKSTYCLDTSDLSHTATGGAELMLNVLCMDGVITPAQVEYYSQNVVILATEPGWLRKLWNKLAGGADSGTGVAYYAARFAGNSQPKPRSE